MQDDKAKNPDREDVDEYREYLRSVLEEVYTRNQSEMRCVDLPLCEDFKLAIRLYTQKDTKPVAIYRVVNSAFQNPERNEDLLVNRYPFMKLLILALQELGKVDSYLVAGVDVFRGVNVAHSELLKAEYDSCVHAVPDGNPRYFIGKQITCPAFTSFSFDLSVAKSFSGTTNGIIFQFIGANGYDVSELSAFAKEREIIALPAEQFQVVYTVVDRDNLLHVIAKRVGRRIDFMTRPISASTDPTLVASNDTVVLASPSGFESEMLCMYQ
jgi:hypothetical protein